MLLAFVLGEVIAVLKMGVFVIFLSIPVMVIIKIITKKHVSVFVVVFLFIFLGYCLSQYKLLQKDWVWELEEKNVIAKGRAGKIIQSDYGYQLFLEETVIDNTDCGETIIFFENYPDIKIGNLVEISGKIKHFERARNKGNFDARQYYMSLGIFTRIIAADCKIKDVQYDGLWDRLFQLREKIVENFTKICNERGENIVSGLYQDKAGVFAAITVGDKSELNKEIKELYSVSGIAHILAISGLHISVIGMFVYGMLRRRFSFGLAAFFSIGFVTIFGIVSGMGIATLRAFMMFALRLIGDVFGRKYDYLTAISLTGLILMLQNPFIIVNSGFQMSFAATIALTIVLPQIFVIMNLKSKVVKNVMFSVGIGLVINPLIAYYYFQLPLYSFLLNIVVVPLMSIVVISAILGSMAVFISVSAGQILILPACCIIEIYNTLCNIITKIPFSNIIVGKPSILSVVLYYVILSVFIYCFVILRQRVDKRNDVKEHTIEENGRVLVSRRVHLKQERKTDIKFRSSFGAFCLVISFLVYIHFQNGINIKFIDVGQGDCIFIRTDNGVTLMIDGGSTTVSNVGKYRIAPCIKADGQNTIDYAIVTHADEDHTSGLKEMLEASDLNGLIIRNVVLPDIYMKDEAYQKIISLAVKKGINVLYITKGDVLKFGETEIRCIHPGREYIADDRNSYSTVLSLKYGKFSVLFTGDISSEQEIQIKQAVKENYIVLKSAHHGSNYSSSNEFLKIIKPEYTIISVGKNNRYGHPGKETLERLENIKTRILRTDDNGEIEFNSDGENMRISCFHEDN